MTTILYHRDFDGAVSAAICRRELTDRGVVVTGTRSIDYGDNLAWVPDGKPVWPLESKTEPFVIVDFQYHPYALAWFDHHKEPFPIGTQPHYELRLQAGDDVIWKPTAPSCAEVMAHWSRGGLAFWERLVTAANKIDTAAYSSADEMYRSAAPEILLQIIGPDMSDSERIRVINALTDNDLDEAAWTIRKRALVIQARRAQELRHAASFVRRYGRVAVLDSASTNLPFLRFAPLVYEPDVDYHAGIYATRNGVALSIAFNPWGGTDRLQLGTWLKQNTRTGGGHDKAAAYQVTPGMVSSPYHECWRVLNQLIQVINNAETNATVAPSGSEDDVGTSR